MGLFVRPKRAATGGLCCRDVVLNGGRWLGWLGLRDAEGERGAGERGPSSTLSPSKRVTLGHSPFLPLVSTLNGNHVCPDFPQVYRDSIQGNGTVNLPYGPEGAGGMGHPHILVPMLPHTDRHPQSINTG